MAIIISQEERDRAILRSCRKFQTDLRSDLATAEDNGERRGRMERSVEIARKLLETDLPSAQISALTGLTHEELENLRRES